ncbi:MAG: hypothetical protein KJ714_02630 [Euryarchaeota archaeon]|nr:hypothetical protein [Euryarchaeota archaeon]
MKIISVFILLTLFASAINTQAQPEQPPFNATHAVSVPHLSPGDRNVGIEFILQNNRDVSIEEIVILGAEIEELRTKIKRLEKKNKSLKVEIAALKHKFAEMEKKLAA